MTEKFIIGQVGAPFGVKGFVKVRVFSGEIDHFLKMQSVVLRKDGKEQTLSVNECTPAPPSVLIHFEGIDSPEKAKTLSGAQLIAGRDQAAPLGEGEYYIEDLKGLAVLSDKDEIIGHVTDIIEGGSGELVEIKPLSGGEKYFIPFRKEFFSEISLEKGRLTLCNTWILKG
ncbi:MAG: ribosome maturation factor RimM [Treponema sp.]|nr:ribosome maturation factor RimM [Treponema sp.]MCL2272566.1 ribosome maturation factor RimM [Treponema sp.]